MSELHTIPTISGSLSPIPTLSGNLSEVINYTAYNGTYEITPKAGSDQVLETANKMMAKDVIVKKIPIYKVNNSSMGKTVYIGGEM